MTKGEIGHMKGYIISKGQTSHRLANLLTMDEDNFIHQMGVFKDIQEIKNTLAGQEIKGYTNQDRLNIMLEHLELEIEEKGEYVGIREMRKHLCWYVKNLKNSSKLREEVNKIEEKEELVQVLKEYFKSI